MKKNLLIFILTLISFSIPLSAQTSIFIPRGTSPVMDGKVDKLEWNDSDTVFIPITSDIDKVTVIYKRDSANFYFAFIGVKNHKYPEILFDVKNDKGDQWKMDDWWFHLSFRDCEYQGEPDRYENCQDVRPNWVGVPNFSAEKNIDSVEIKIPFKTLGLNVNAQTSTIGIAFQVFADGKKSWPVSANIIKPSTWGTASF